jgi:hypothetical protein
MTEPDTNTDDDRTDDQFDTTIDARDADDQPPPAACRGCDREVTLLSNGFCGFCQGRDGDADKDGPDPRPDGGTASAPPADGPDWDSMDWRVRIDYVEPVDIVRVPWLDCSCSMVQGHPGADDPDPCPLEARYLVVVDVPFTDDWGPEVWACCPGDMRRWRSRNPVDIRRPASQKMMPDGGVAQTVDDWERAAAVAADADDLVRCGDWLAVRRDDIVLGASNGGARAAMPVSDARTQGVTPRTSGRTTVQAGDIRVDALEVGAVRADGDDQQNAQDDVGTDAGGPDLATPDPADARRAVVDAARYDGTTVIRGAYQARRTVFEPWPKGKPGQTRQAVKLDARTGPARSEFVGYVAATPFQALWDDWERPSPVDPGDVVLPADDFDVDDLFPSPAMLPGRPGDADDGGDI